MESRAVNCCDDCPAAVACEHEARQRHLDPENDLDDDHELWCVNEQIKDLLQGWGATEDNEAVLSFFRSTGLPEGTVKRIHKAIVCAEK